MGELFLNYINSIKQGNAYKLSHHSLLLHDWFLYDLSENSCTRNSPCCWYLEFWIL